MRLQTFKATLADLRSLYPDTPWADEIAESCLYELCLAWQVENDDAGAVDIVQAQMMLLDDELEAGRLLKQATINAFKDPVSKVWHESYLEDHQVVDTYA